MTKPALKALMVDVDGVIVHPADPRGWKANMQDELGLAPADLQSAFFALHWPDVILGKAAMRERLEPTLADIAPHLTYEQLRDYWFHHDSELDHGLLAQLAVIRQNGVQLHLATVQEHERAGYLWHDLQLSAHFDAMHYAADIGHAKPAPEFYAAIETRTGFAAHQLFLIDDSPANVEGAKLAGWHAAVWTGKERLVDVLGGFG